MTSDEEMMFEKIKEYRASGKTLPAYCAENEISLDKMKYWMYSRDKRKLLSAAVDGTKGGRPAFASYEIKGRDTKGAGITLEIKGVTITLERGFDKALFLEVKEALLA